MKNLSIVASVLALCALSSASPVPAEEPLSCTKTIFTIPPEEVDCTLLSHTKTVTSFTDCAGCSLVTRQLGVGIPCQTVTTVPGTTTKTVTSCSPVLLPPRQEFPPTPTSTCTKVIRPTIGALSSKTCTFYDAYTTKTAHTNCHGCALTTEALGPGPVVQCGTKVTKPLGTTTVTTCKTPHV